MLTTRRALRSGLPPAPQALARRPNAFTILELTIAALMIGILAAVVIPRFVGVTDDAKTAALQSTLAAVRSSAASFRARAVISGTPAYPTLAELQTAGTVLQQPIPVNPYNKSSAVQAVSAAQADARAVVSPTQYGWNYFVDNSSNPPRAVFYANTSTTTTAPKETGGFFAGNEL